MEKVKKLLGYLTYQERRKRKLGLFLQEEKKYRTMPQDELVFEYIELKARYGGENIVSTLFAAMLSLAMLIGIWDLFFKFMNSAIEYAASCNDSEVAEVFFCIAFTIAFSVSFLLLYCLLTTHRDRIEDKKKLMMIECVMEERAIKITQES